MFKINDSPKLFFYFTCGKTEEDYKTNELIFLIIRCQQRVIITVSNTTVLIKISWDWGCNCFIIMVQKQ